MTSEAGCTEERIELGALKQAILDSNEIEEWHREMLLAEVGSLEDFYRTRLVREPAMSSR